VSLRTTPFHPRTGPLSEGQAWRRWAGYVVASSYELSHDREYHAIRNSAALFDVSPLYKYMVTGKDASRLLDHVVTRNVAKAKVGQVLYTPWCDDEGKQIDDGTISVLGEQTFRMTSADPTLRWLHLNSSGLDVTIQDVSETTAAVSLQGPSAREILQLAAERDLSALKYFRLTSAKIRGIPVTISRTGYTGDLGFEVWVDASQAVPLWDALIETGTPYGITPAGMLALDVARIEAGLLLIEVDYFSSRHALIESQKSSPAGPSPPTRHATTGRRRSMPSGSAARRGSSPASPSTGIRLSSCTPTWACRRGCRARRGARASRSTIATATSSSATRRAAAGRRCSSVTWRWRISVPSTLPERKSAWKSPWSIAASRRTRS